MVSKFCLPTTTHTTPQTFVWIVGSRRLVLSTPSINDTYQKILSCRDLAKIVKAETFSPDWGWFDITASLQPAKWSTCITAMKSLCGGGVGKHQEYWPYIFMWIKICLNHRTSQIVWKPVLSCAWCPSSPRMTGHSARITEECYIDTFHRPGGQLINGFVILFNYVWLVGHWNQTTPHWTTTDRTIPHLTQTAPGLLVRTGPHSDSTGPHRTTQDWTEPDHWIHPGAI